MQASPGGTVTNARRSAGDGTQRVPLVRIAGRTSADRGRTSPRMRLDLLQVVAWVSGLALIVIALVALARAGFDQVAFGEPVVEVIGLPATPLLAMLMLGLGLLLLAASTGEVDERRLRIGGVLIGVVGAVWVMEPDAFAELLGIERGNGSAALMIGVTITLASFVPPLSVRRPGVPDHGVLP